MKRKHIYSVYDILVSCGFLFVFFVLYCIRSVYVHDWHEYRNAVGRVGVIFIEVGYPVSFAIGVTLLRIFHRFEIEGDLVTFGAIAFSKGVIDEDWNWEVLISEVKDVELVKLSKEEKKKYTSSRFLFSKYLKVTTKNDKYKYIYVSHFTKKQIERIINILLQR